MRSTCVETRGRPEGVILSLQGEDPGDRPHASTFGSKLLCPLSRLTGPTATDFIMHATLFVYFLEKEVSLLPASHEVILFPLSTSSAASQRTDQLKILLKHPNMIVPFC